jgi:hypothetical protein
MGIDIYATWKGQTAEEANAQENAWLSPTAGKLGYLRETCCLADIVYATEHLCFEAFAEDNEDVGEARISAALLRSRLPRALELIEDREYSLYCATEEEVDAVKDSFRDFVDLCEQKERETGEPIVIIARCP